MNSYDVNQLDKLELKRIAIGKKLHKGDSSVSVADDLTINRDLYVDRDIHIVNQIQLGKYTDYGQEMPGAMKVVGSLSVSGNAYLGTNVQTTTIRNDIVVEDTLSVAGSVTVATCQNELPSNFMEFTRTRHATDDNTHVLIEKGDSLGSILFKGSDGTNWKKYVDIQTLSTSVEQDNEGGKIQFNILSGGGAHSGDDGTTNTSYMFNLFSIGGENKSEGINNQVVVNEAGINTDFRVESDLNENMIFVDSLANKIGIARDSPQYTLDIQGNSRISDHLLLNTISVGADSHGTHKAVIREDLGGSDMSALIYNTQLALFSTAKQSMNMGVMTDGKGVIQVIDNNNPSITYADLGIQPLGGQIAIGKQLANVVLDIEATDSIRIPVGTVAERPTANSSNHTGYLRYNSELKRFEGYGQSHNQSLLLDEWVSLGGLKDVDNDTYITVENQHGSDNDQIKFFVEDRQEMTLDKSGYLGIGITNPTTRLHVESNDPSYNNTEPIALFRSANKDTSVRIEGTGESYLELANVDTTGDATNSWGIGINNDKNLYFNWKTNSTLDTDTTINESNAMTIMQNGNIGVNKLVPNVTFDIEGEDAIRIPRGTTAQRPSTLGLGQIRYNTQLHTFEGYGAGNAWGSLGGVKDVDRDTFITAENSAGADNDELKFYTNQFEENIDASTVPRMIIKNDGKIGIHTNTPLVKFQITDQSILTGTNITNGTASIYGTSGQSSYQILNVSHTNQSEYISIGFNEVAKQGTYDGPLKINNKKNNDIVFGTNDADRMILKNDGKLGLGVSSPDTLLHVQKSGSQEPIAIFESTNGDSSIRIEGTGESYLEIANKDTTGDSTNSWGIGMNDDKNLYFNWKTNGTLNYDTNINERNAMTIMQNGNVGINKATPNVTFDIEGEDAIRIPRGNTAQRPTTLGLGQIRYNTQLHTFEGYGAGNAWGSLGGVKDVDRDTYITAEDSAGADNDELKFYTGQFEETVTATTVPRMIIKNDGKVGINIISPLYKTHINGNVGVEDSVTLQDTLSVSGTTNLTGNTIIGSKATTTHQLHVEGTTNITGATTLDNTLDVTGASILNSTLSVSGISRFSSDLTTVGKISARHTTQNVGVEITPFGGNTATNGGGRVFFRESHNSNNYGFSLGFNGGDGLNPSNLAWPSNTFCISRHNGNSSGDVVLSIDRTSNNVGLGTGIPTSNLHIKQTSGSNDCMIKIEADGGTGSNKPNTGIEFITNDGNPDTPTSSQPVYTSSKILSGWNQSEESYNQSFFKIQTHHQDSTLNDSFTIKGQDVGINNNSPQFTLDIDGTLNTTGATTLNNGLTVTGGVTTLGSSTSHHLYVKGNDIALGQNAGPTGGRALVHRSVDNTLILNYKNDFSNGVRIGGDSDNNPASNLTVTGATTLSDTLGVTGNTTLDGELTVGDPAHEKLKIHIDNINKYAILEYTPKNVQGTLLGKGELSFGGSQTNVGHSTGDIQFNTASANRMIIKNDGNVGIGTNTPTSKLHVMGEIFSSVSGNPNPTGISIIPHGSGTANVGGRIAFVEDTSTIPRGFSLAYNGGSGLDNTTFTNSLPSDTFGILRHNANSGAEASSASLVIKRDNGDVGIGTNSPNSKLHVNGTLNITGTATLGSDSSDNLYIKCNDVSLGPNAAYGQARAMVAYNSGSQLVLNWANDFGSGVRIGNPVNGETSNLNVTGNLTVGQGMATTNNTHDNSYANIYKNGNGYAVFSNTRVATNPASISMGAEMYIDTPTSSMFFNTGVYPNNSTKMFIAHAGNVGIGTTSPTTKLHIYDDIANTSNTASTNLTNQMLILETKYNHDWNNPHSGNPNGAPHTGGCGITFKISDNNNSHYGEINYIGRGVVGEGTSGEDDGALQFKVSNNSVDSGGGTTEVMRIDYNGNVGIGNNNPEKKLDVSGTFRATGITTLSNTLEVTGATTLSDTLGVTKATTLSNTLGVSGHTTLSTLGVSGLTTLSNTLGVSGHTTLSTLGVTGATTIGGETQINNNLLKVIGTQPVFRLSRNSYNGSSSDSGGGTIALGNKDFDEAQIHSITTSNKGDTHRGALCLSTKTHTIMKEAIYIKPPTYIGPSTEVHTNANYAGGNVGIGTTDPQNNKLRIMSTGITDLSLHQHNSQLEIHSGGNKSLGIGVMDNGTGIIQVKEIGNGAGYRPLILQGLAGNVGIGIEPTSKLQIKGSVNSSHFYYGDDEDVYIRGGKDSGDIFLNHGTSGKVGIGNNNPQYKLDITGTMRTTGNTTLDGELTVGNPAHEKLKIHIDNINKYAILEYTPKNAQGTLLGKGELSFGGSQTNVGHSTGDIQFNTASANRMIIKNDGNVGIGTTNPYGPLHITKTFTDYAANATGMAAQDTASRSASWNDKRKAIPRLIVGRENAQGSTTKSANTTIASIDLFNHVDKLATITGVVHAGQHMPSIVFNTKPTYVGNDDYIERMVIRESGNVGIGTNTPTSKLHVMGEIFSSVSGNPNSTGISIIPHGSGTANVGGRIAFLEDTSPIPRGFSLAYNGGSGLDNTTFTNSLPDDTFGILRHDADSGAEASSASLVIKRDNGDVGIGKTNPEKKLDVSGTFRATGATTLSNTLDVTGATSLATGGGAVNISKSGVMTTVKGQLNVDQAVTLDTTLSVTGETNLNGGLKMDNNKFTVANDTGNTNINGTLDVEGATILSSTLSIASDVKVSGNLLLQGGKKFHIGSSTSNNIPDAVDSSIFMISGQHNTIGTTSTMFKIKGYDNEATSQKVIRYASENEVDLGDDYYFKSRVSNEGDGGFHYYKGSIGIGTEDTSVKLNVAGTTKITGATTLSSTLGVSGHTTLSTLGVTGATTLNSGLTVTGAATTLGSSTNHHLHVKGNDITLGPNNRRALVNSGNTLIINYGGDFTEGVSVQGNATFGGFVTGNLRQKGALNDNYIEYMQGTTTQALVGFSGGNDFYITNQQGTNVKINNHLQVTETLNVTQAATIGGNLTVNGTELRINGDLVVEGTTTTLNTTNLDITDKDITLAKNSNNNAAANGAGFIIDAGNDTNKEFKYNSTGDKFTTNIPLDVKGTINCKNGDLDCGIKIIPQAAAGAFTNAGGRIFFKEDSGGDTMGFSLAYNGGNDLQTIGSVLPEDNFGIIRHSYSASGAVAVSIHRDTGIVKIMNNLDMNNNKITNVANPTSNQDAATKKYVDDNAGGSSFNNITESGSVTTITGETAFIPTGGGHASHFYYSLTGDTHIRSKSSSNYVYIQDTGGNTQIGPNGSGYLGVGRNPSYNLDVNGNARFSGATTHSGGLLVEENNSLAPGSNYNKLRWTSNNSGTFAYTSMDGYNGRALGSNHYVSLRCNGRALFNKGIWYPRAAKESDRRIKRDIQPVEFEETLKIIRETPLRKYTYIDPKNISSEVHHGYRTYGFIAQELEEAFPLAVDTSYRFIPNIFSFYSDNKDFLQEEDKKPIRCEYVTENNNLLLKVPSLRKKLTKTEKIIDYCRIIVKETILKEEDEKEFEIFKEDADYTYFKVEKQYYWVFIYGFMVSDFKSVDTDDVLFLHHKAIQDIDTVQQAEKTKVETLETQNTELLSKVNNLETENTQLKDKVADLENQIKAIKEHLGM